MPEVQSYKNHTRFDPPFHYVILPLLLLNFIFSIYIAVHHWPEHPHLHLWWIVMAIVFILMAGNARGSALKAQDRLIRLEERLRLPTVLSGADLAASHQLTEAQLIALRFASDAELPTLVQRTLAENLTRKQIKQTITNWRADNFRV